jgi:hypothetical protein
MKRIILKGKKFSRLLVLKDFIKGGRSFAKCKCDCGNESEVRSSQLTSGSTKSCGCLRNELTSKRMALPEGEASFNHLFGAYKRGAANRGYEFSLNKELFRKLTKSDCHYCGEIPFRTHTGKGAYTSYIYNGIDRQNNAVGYTEENSVPCCKVCNFAKRDLSLDDFFKWVLKTSKHIRRSYDTR